LWLDQSKTLRQQGIDEHSTVVLKRKYFFSDKNIDQGDPVQLNLLYVQCRNGIIDGTHPVTFEEAIQFAGLQCQIQFGDYNESKHKPGILDIKDLLPKEYTKIKGVEKRIFLKHSGLSEPDAKLKYTQLCRSLRTYGVTFFLVKEKMPGKNKLIPRLLGVTKDSIVRVDERTKEFNQVWPLTHVKRWTASPNTFTLDFGDYATAYYSVQTNDGEQISQLIAGYIDIILKKKKDREYTARDNGEDEATMVEDVVSPAKATIIQPNRPPFGYIHTENVYSPPLMRGTLTDGGRLHHQHLNDYGHEPMMSMPSYYDMNQRNNIHQQEQEAEYFTQANERYLESMHPMDYPSSRRKTLFTTIENARNSIHTAQSQLARELHLEYLHPHPDEQQWSRENRSDVSRQILGSELCAINASTAQIVTLTSDQHRSDEHSLGAAISTITNNLYEFCKEMKVYSAITEVNDQTNPLMDATRRLCSTFSDLLLCIESDTADSMARQSLLVTASRLGEVSQDLIKKIGSNGTNDDILDSTYQERLLSLAKSVANATALYVYKAKDIASNVNEQQYVNDIISTATQCALATSQLVACTKVVSATISSPLCQEQLIESTRYVTRSIEAVLNSCNQGTASEQMLLELDDAAKSVTKTVNDLLLHIKQATESAALSTDVGHFTSATPNIASTTSNVATTQHDESIDKILTASDRLFSCVGDASEMVKQAKVLAQATAQLVSSLRQQAESTIDDTNQQKKLLSAAKMLADATAKMVEAAKGCATKPNDTQLQYHLKKAAEELRQCAKNCASSATQCIAATQGSAQSNKNAQSHQQLAEQCKQVADLIPKLVQGIRGIIVKPDAFSSQINLINSCDDFIGPATRLTNLAKAAVPTIQDQSQALHLNNSLKQLTQANIDLRSCLTRAQELCGAVLDVETIIESIDLLDKELIELQKQAKDGKLRPKLEETIDTSSAELYSVCKQVGSAVSQLLNAVTQGDENCTGICARDTLNTLKKLTNSIRGIAASSSDYRIQETIINSSRELLEKSTKLVKEAKKAVHLPQDREIQTRLAEIAKEVQSALNACLTNMPSQRYIDDALKQISEYVYTLAGPYSRKPSRTFDDVQTHINHAAADLNNATTELVVSARSGTTALQTTTQRFSHAFGEFIDNGIDLAGCQEDEKRSKVISSLKQVHTSSSELLERAKSASIDITTTATSTRNPLTLAAKAVTESINDVITSCLATDTTTKQSSVGRLECDNAIREMQTSKTILQHPIEPVTDYTYFEALDHVVDYSKNLGSAMTNVASAVKNTNHPLFSRAVRDASTAVCGLSEASGQAAYLIGVSDSSSTKGKSGIVDQQLFHHSVNAIRQACNDLSSSTIDKNEILSCATTIARNTSALCNAARDASSRTTNALARRSFVQSAKDVANATANLVRSIKILDSSYAHEHHRECIEKSRPLLQSIDELYTYAMSKEFSSIPASISIAGRQLQEPILSAARNVVDGACKIVECSKTLILNSKEPSQWQQLATHTKTVSESIKRLATSVKEMTPGSRECERAIEELRILFHNVDKAIMNIGSLPKTDKSLQFHQEQISSSSHFMSEYIEDIRRSAKREPERLGSCVTQLTTYVEPLVRNTIDYVSRITNSRQQTTILEQLKSVVEIGLQLLLSAKESGGNVKSIQWHKVVDENSSQMISILRELVHTIEENSSSIGIMSGLCENIRKSIQTVDSNVITDGLFQDYQTCMVEIVRQMARTTQDILTKSSSNEDIKHLATQLTRKYNELIRATYGAIGTASTTELASRIKRVVIELGETCIELIQKIGQLQQNPHDQTLKHEIQDLCQKVIEKISYVLAALQASARGTQACINAASTVSGIIADLDTTILFATAGTLNSECDGETFADHREAILKTAKALVEDTKTLVAGAASSQEQLASAAQAAVRTITKLAEVVKLGAASLGAEDGEAQVLLINSVKDVAQALNNLISVTKSASGKDINDPEMQKLKESAKIMVTNVTSLLKTVKSVEDEASRGTNALEAAIEAIAQEIREFSSDQSPSLRTPPEELIRVAKQLTVATSKAISAGQSCRQDEIIAAANLGRKSISDLLFVCKCSAYTTAQQDLRQRTLDSGKNCAKYYKELLETIHILLQKPSNETKQKLLIYLRSITQSTQDLVHCAEQLKGSDWIDPDDPTYIAESELLLAAQSIEAAAKKLSYLKPRQKIKVLPMEKKSFFEFCFSMICRKIHDREINENLNFDEQILEAAKSIMNAAGALIKGATAAQKELVSQGKLSHATGRRRSNQEEDGQWSQGLISAARYVAVACHSLCDAANGLVQGHGTEEKLISAAKQVSSNTAALLVACKVKADFMSQSMTRLQNAGNAVKRATDALVRSSQQAVEMQEEEKYLEVSMRFVPGIAQEIKAKEIILTKERELDEARNRLKALHLAKYGHVDKNNELYQSS
ncbi:unnamed protein product, partial [Didymodactylos carnosus]